MMDCRSALTCACTLPHPFPQSLRGRPPQPPLHPPLPTPLLLTEVDPTSQLRESLVRGGAEPLGEAGLSTQQYTAPTQYAGNEGPVVV